MFSRFRGGFSSVINTVKNAVSRAIETVITPFKSIADIDIVTNIPVQDIPAIPDSVIADEIADYGSDDTDTYEPVVDIVSDTLRSMGFSDDIADILDGVDATEYKGYIEADYILELEDGDTLYSSIRFYGTEDKLHKAIIAKHGDLHSSQIVGVHILEEA